VHLINNTPFQTLAVPTVCHQDKNHLVIIVKASFDIVAGSDVLSVSDEQQEILLADKFWGEPDQSSLRYESDIALVKPGTDVAVIGSIYPDNPPVRVAEAVINVGSYRKTIRVSGDRYWAKGRVGYQISSPEPFDKMALVYENAYGGQCLNADSEMPSFDERNPCGKGFIDIKSKVIPEALALPNLENPQQLISDIKQQPDPWCCGFVSRAWAPRKNFTGTYDEDWLKNRNPLLPVDFDINVNNAASAGLIVKPYLQGGELVQLENLSPQGRLSFHLPTIDLKTETSVKAERNQHQMVMDTLVIEPDKARVSLTWRTSRQVNWNLSMIEWIKIGWQQRGHH